MSNRRNFRNRFYEGASAEAPWSADRPSGYPEWSEGEKKNRRDAGQAVLKQICTASAAGQKQVVIEPGEYLFNADCSRQSTLDGLHDLEIVAEGVTFWFEPPLMHALLFKNCRDIVLRGLTLDFTVPCWFQAQVLSVDRPANRLCATVMSGYEPMDAEGQPEYSGERAFMFYQADGRFINHRHAPTQWTLEDDGITMQCHSGRFGIPAALQPGDYVVGSLRIGMALRSENCANMRYEMLNIWSGPGAAVWEGPGEGTLPEHLSGFSTSQDPVVPEHRLNGGHVYHRIRSTRRPGTNRLHAFGSDIFHLAGSDIGPTLDECELAYGSDDSFNIHGNFGRVVAAEDATQVYLQGVYASGDTLEFRDPESLELLGMAKAVEVHKATAGPVLAINETYEAKSEYLVELDQTLELPPLSLVVMDGKQSNAGFVIRNCWFHDNFQRALVNGSPGGLIEQNLFENLGYGLCVQFETWGPWMEGPFARDLVIRENRFLHCAPEEVVIGVAMFPAGGADRWDAMPVTNLKIEKNTIDAASGFPVKIHNVDGVHICDNDIQLAPLSRDVKRADWRALQEPSNIWRQGSIRMAERWLDIQDCANVTVRGNRLKRKEEP
jgi:hypothetical protein